MRIGATSAIVSSPVTADLAVVGLLNPGTDLSVKLVGVRDQERVVPTMG
jgi:hypothetical protein